MNMNPIKAFFTCLLTATLAFLFGGDPAQAKMTWFQLFKEHYKQARGKKKK